MVAVFCAWVAVVLVVVTALVVGVDLLRHRPDRVPARASSSASSRPATSSTTSRVATAYVAWSLTGVVAFSFMVSCMTDAPFGAIFAGVGLYFTSLILDAIIVARQHPLRAAHALLRPLGRPADPGRVDTPTCGGACSCNSSTCWCSSSSDCGGSGARTSRVDRLDDGRRARNRGRHPRARGRRRSARRARPTAPRAPRSVRSRRGCARCWCSRDARTRSRRSCGAIVTGHASPEARRGSRSGPTRCTWRCRCATSGAGMAVIHGWHADARAAAWASTDHAPLGHVPAPVDGTSTCPRTTAASGRARSARTTPTSVPRSAT